MEHNSTLSKEFLIFATATIILQLHMSFVIFAYIDTKSRIGITGALSVIVEREEVMWSFLYQF